MATRKPDPAHAPPSNRIGRFSLVTELDMGPLGARWLGFVAEGPERGRLVAARRIRTGDDATAATKLDQAARLALGVRHAKVTAVLDVVKSPGEIAVVSEHMDGEPLSNLLSLAVLGNAPIPPAVALAIVRDLVDASLAVHDVWARQAQGRDSMLLRCGHGGLQPDTVLVATFGEALLTEPGVSGAAAALPRYLSQASALPYRAPEQLNDGAAVDERTDVFSAGVILWELLANAPLFGPKDRLRRPTATGNVKELREELLHKPIPSLDTVQRAGAPIHADVAVLVARAVQRDAASRYGSLTELRQAIAELPAGRVATEEQVAVTVDRLARSRIEARRAAFERAVGGRVMDSAPPSSMATDKPAPPSRPLTVVIPGDEWRGDKLAELVGFSATEIPTKSGASAPPDSVDDDRPTALPVDPLPRRAAQGQSPTPPTAKVRPPPPPVRATPGAPSGPQRQPAPPVPGTPAPPLPPDATTSAPEAVAATARSDLSNAGIALAAPPAPRTAPPRRRGRAMVYLGVGVVLLAIAATVGLTVVPTQPSPADAADTSTQEPAPPTAVTTTTEVAAPPPSAAPPDSPQDESLIDDSVDEEPVAPGTTRPPSGDSPQKWDRPKASSTATPRGDDKVFRPSGI